MVDSAEVAALKAQVSDLEVALSKRPPEKIVKSYERELTVMRQQQADAAALTAEVERLRTLAKDWARAAESMRVRVQYLESASRRERRAVAEERAWGWAAGALDTIMGASFVRGTAYVHEVNGAFSVCVEYPRDGGVSGVERTLSYFEDPAP